MKWLVDIEAMVGEGVLTAEQGQILKERAGADALGWGTSLLLVAGIVAVMAGLLALFPTPEGLMGVGLVVVAAGGWGLMTLDGRFRLPANAAAVIGAASATAGAVGMAVEAADSPAPAIWIGLGIYVAGLGLRLFGAPSWRVVAAWVAVFGGATHLGGIFATGERPELAWLAMADAALVLLLAGVLLDLRLLSALSVFALAGTLSATGYIHASYGLAVYEPTLLIALMVVACAVCIGVGKLAERWARHGRIAGLMALIWINIAFWIGSLWGDRPGEYLGGPLRSNFPDGREGTNAFYAARQAFREGLFEIPEGAFAIGWAVLILGVAAWASFTARRPVLNAAATFGAIHLYTQWFERFEAEPLGIIAAGISAILLAWGMVRVNVWMRERKATGVSIERSG